MASPKEVHLSALEHAMGVKFRDPAGVASAFTALMSCGEPDEEDPEEGDTVGMDPKELAASLKG